MQIRAPGPLGYMMVASAFYICLSKRLEEVIHKIIY